MGCSLLPVPVYLQESKEEEQSNKTRRERDKAMKPERIASPIDQDEAVWESQITKRKKKSPIGTLRTNQ